MAIGEAGSVTTNSPVANQPITVNLTDPLTDPVYALTATNNGGNQFTLRIVGETTNADGDVTSFQFIIEEWEYHDGAHQAVETINWIAVEEGVHTLPDGRIIEAGTTTADNTNSSVSFAGSHTDPPIVLTSVMSNNDTTTVDSDPLNVTASGFNVRLQEEEAEDNIHANETVGWIAIETGGDTTSGTAQSFGGLDENVDVHGLGGTFTNSVVIAETQTINGGDPGTVVIDSQSGTQVGVFFEEEASQDSELNHINETVGIAAFEDGLIPCFTQGTLIETPLGLQPVEALGAGAQVLTPEGPRTLLRSFGRRLTRAELVAAPNLFPVRILAGALGLGLPKRDLLVSPQHRMMVNTPIVARMFGTPEVLVAAKKLVGQPGVYVETDLDEVHYIHLLFASHAIVFAEGAASESLLLGQEALRMLTPGARREITTLFPEIKDPGYSATPARPIPAPRRQKALTTRMAKNRRLALEADLTAMKLSAA